MMKVKVLIIVLIISLGINVGTIVKVVYHKRYMRKIEERGPFTATPFQSPFPPEHSLRHSFLKHKLKLNEEQINAIEATQTKTRARITSIRQKLSVKRRELMDLLKESEPDEVRLNTLFKEVANLQTEIELCIFEDIRQATETLTPEQKQQFFELFQERLFGRGMHQFPPEQEHRLESRRKRGFDIKGRRGH